MGEVRFLSQSRINRRKKLDITYLIWYNINREWERGGVGSTFPLILCNNCLGRTTGEHYGLSDLTEIGEGETPTSPASGLRSSDADVFD